MIPAAALTELARARHGTLRALEQRALRELGRKGYGTLRAQAHGALGWVEFRRAALAELDR